MAHKYQYKCEGKINLQRDCDREEFPTTVWIETNLYEPTIQTATEYFENMLSKYAACTLLIVSFLRLIGGQDLLEFF